MSQETRNTVIQLLDEQLGDGNEMESNKPALFQKIKDMHANIMVVKDKIESQLSLASSDEEHSKLLTALTEAEQCRSDVERVTSHWEQLSTQVDSHVKEIVPKADALQKKLQKVPELERALGYLRCVGTVLKLSSEIKLALLEENESSAVEKFRSLAHLAFVELASSQCRHFLRFARETTLFWHSLLKDQFGSELEQVLKTVQWPFVAGTLPSVPPMESVMRLQTLIRLLLQINLPSEDEKSGHHRPLLPLQLLLKPLMRRFTYHFQGPRKTNDPSKPEWYLSEVLKWSQQHGEFLKEHVQPVLEEKWIGEKKISAWAEFCRGLTEFVVDKIHSDLHSEALESDDGLFCHTIDEALLFQREMDLLYAEAGGQQGDGPSALAVLTEAPYFQRWISIEKKKALEKMDVIFSSDSVWSVSCDAKASDRDVDFKVTECAEGFIMLLASMSDRYKDLPQPGHRLQFLELELELLDDFRVRCIQLARSSQSHSNKSSDNGSFSLPLNVTVLCPLLNTIHYVSWVLKDWGDTPFFLTLQYYRAQYNPLEWEPQSDGDNNIESQVGNLEGTVFDEVLDLFGHAEEDMLQTVIAAVMSCVRNNVNAYRNEKWFAMLSPKDYVRPAVTPTACTLLQGLSRHLHELHKFLGTESLATLWKTVCKLLDQILVDDVICCSLFNEGGALQMHFDITRNLFPLFGEFTQKPESYFRRTKESCLLLTMAKGPAMLLLDALSEEGSSELDNIARREALSELDVESLNPSEAIDILQRRTDLGYS